jgi:hypothetical protein
MFRSLTLAALFSIALISGAFSQEIVATGVGRAEARSQRSVVTIIAPGGATQTDRAASSLDALERLVRQADPSASAFTGPNPDGAPLEEILSAVPNRRIEIATERASGVSAALLGFEQSGVAVSYQAIPSDPAALRSAAMSAAFVNAREQAQQMAAAANLQLGRVMRIEQGGPGFTQQSFAIARATGGFGQAPETQASESQAITVTFSATPR